MSTPGFSITLNDQAVQATLTRPDRPPRQHDPASDDIGRALQNLTVDAFAAETSPFGGA